MADRHDEPFPDKSRRRFLQAAAVAVAGAASGVVGPAAQIVTGPRERSSAPGDSDCSDDGAVPLLAAAVISGEYAALASTSEGPRLFSLSVNGDQTVTLGPALSVATPADFEPTSVGVARNRFVLSGGRGIAPAAFLVDRAVVEPIALPGTSAHVFATVGDVAETTQGALVVMIEHSDGEPRSRYAAAVDVFEEVAGGWELRVSARNLGKSGPNRLVVKSDAIGVELNTSRGGLGGDELVRLVPVAGATGQAIALGRRSARLVHDVSRVL